MSVAHGFLSSAVGICALGAAIDLRTGQIPNFLTLTPLALAPLAHFAWAYHLGGVTAGVLALGVSLFGAVVAVALPSVLYVAGAMFGGDLKLMAAVGALVMPSLALEAVLYTFVAGAVLSLLHMAWIGKLRIVLRNSYDIAANPFRSAADKRVVAPEKLTFSRFGPAIFVGVTLACALAWRA